MKYIRFSIHYNIVVTNIKDSSVSMMQQMKGMILIFLKSGEVSGGFVLGGASSSGGSEMSRSDIPYAPEIPCRDGGNAWRRDDADIPEKYSIAP